MWVQSLGWEDPLEESMTTHSSILAWEIPRIGEPDRLQSTGSQRVRHDRATKRTCTRVWLPEGPVSEERSFHRFFSIQRIVREVSEQTF